jgi:hypothetical protein
MDIAGRVMHGAITEEQLAKLSALTHWDVGSVLRTILAYVWYGGMLHMRSLFPMLDWLFSGVHNKKANEHIKLRIRVHRKWRLSWPASSKLSAFGSLHKASLYKRKNLTLLHMGIEPHCVRTVYFPHARVVISKADIRKNPNTKCWGLSFIWRLEMTYSRMGRPQTTIGDTVFHF